LNPREYGKAYNVAGEEVMTWNQFWKIIAEVMSVPPLRLVYIPTQVLGNILLELSLWCMENFQYLNVFDVSRAKKELGFVYRTSWREGVKRCLLWLEEHGRFENSDSPKYAFYDVLLAKWEGLVSSLQEDLSRFDQKSL